MIDVPRHIDPLQPMRRKSRAPLIVWLMAVMVLTACLVPLFRLLVPATKRPAEVKADKPERPPRTWQEHRIRTVEEWARKNPFPYPPALPQENKADDGNQP